MAAFSIQRAQEQLPETPRYSGTGHRAGGAPREQLSSTRIAFTILAPLALQPPSDVTHTTQYKVPCHKCRCLKKKNQLMSQKQMAASRKLQLLLINAGYGWQQEIPRATETNEVNEWKSETSESRGRRCTAQVSPLSNQEPRSDNTMICKCLSPTPPVSLHQNKTFSEVLKLLTSIIFQHFNFHLPA